MKVHAIELSQQTDVYAWDRVELPENLHYTCVSESVDSRSLGVRHLRELVGNSLAPITPDVVAINGWSDNGALATLHWCQRNRVPTILMSESNRFDEPRRPVQEWVKRQIVQGFSSALVGGSSAKDYVVELGIPADRVFKGYDVIDNDHFSLDKDSKHSSLGDRICARPYFLASNRFIDKKNLPRLIQAYAKYRESLRGSDTGVTETWDLVMLGDGPMRDDLIALTSKINLTENVHFVGFKQYNELPAYYWNAGAFVHASTTEQWGLVVNEAMAAGLPVLVSNRCGSASDLVHEGVNGFTFDPTNVDEIAGLMCRVAVPDFPRSDFGIASQRIIADWGPDRFATGLKAAAEVALKIGPKRSGMVDRLLLELLCRR